MAVASDEAFGDGAFSYMFVSLTPPLGRGKIVRCLSAAPATEFAKPVCAKDRLGGGCFLSPRERAKGEGKRRFDWRWVSLLFTWPCPREHASVTFFGLNLPLG